MTLLHKVLAASDEDAEEERLLGEMPGKFLVIMILTGPSIIQTL